MSFTNYGSTRTPKLQRGTTVLCQLYREIPEHVSRRTGELKPKRVSNQILVGTVLSDRGNSLYVKVQYPSGYKRDTAFLAHEVSSFDNFYLGIGNNEV